MTGQKYCRATVLGADVALCISSCSPHPFFCHRQRGTVSQLTAACYCCEWWRRFGYNLKWNEKDRSVSDLFCLAPQTGLEPVTPRLTAACSANWAIEALNKKCRRRLIFPGGCPPSIFSAEELNYRVRDGNGWTLFAIDTDSIWNTVFSVFLPFWWPVADSNRCCRRERPES